MKTYTPKPQDIERRWYVLDAQDAVLGRLATQVATILRGKHKPIYAPHADTGDHVIIVNAKGVVLTGGKESKKIAYRHSGYPGGLRETKYDRLMSTRPSFAVEKAIKGMLPKNRLGRSMAGKLAVYDGAEHPHAAQKPEPLALGEFPKWTGLPKPAAAAPAEKKAGTKTAAAKAGATTTAKPKAASTARKPAASAAKPKAATKKTETKPKKATTAKKTTTAKTTTKKPAAKKTTTKKATAKKPAAKKTEKKG